MPMTLHAKKQSSEKALDPSPPQDVTDLTLQIEDQKTHIFFLRRKFFLLLVASLALISTLVLLYTKEKAENDLRAEIIADVSQ